VDIRRTSGDANSLAMAARLDLAVLLADQQRHLEARAELDAQPAVAFPEFPKDHPKVIALDRLRMDLAPVIAESNPGSNTSVVNR
jgi:hypothetical protein